MRRVIVVVASMHGTIMGTCIILYTRYIYKYRNHCTSPGFKITAFIYIYIYNGLFLICHPSAYPLLMMCRSLISCNFKTIWSLETNRVCRTIYTFRTVHFRRRNKHFDLLQYWYVTYSGTNHQQGG